MMKSISLTFTTVLLSAATLHGATLNGIAVETTITSRNINLTTLGDVNWAAWDPRSGTEVSSIAPGASHFTGAGIISAITGTNGGNVRSTTEVSLFPTAVDFSWSNGTAAAPSDGTLTGVFHSTFETTGIGTQFSITSLPALAAGQSYLIHVFTSSYRGTSTLSATSGINTISLEGGVKGTTSHLDWYQFNYNPDSPADVLTISNLLTTNGAGGTSRSFINAVAIQTIPEPSSLIFLAGAATSLLGRRKRS